MDTKEQLVKSVKEWVKIDNEIRSLQEEIKKEKTIKNKFQNH